MSATVIPTLQYRDAGAAIDWLCRAFGFDRRSVYKDESGRVQHAELTYGNGMIMLGTWADDAWGRLVAPPGRDGPNTQSAFVIIDDADAHHDRAVAAGARIVFPLEDKPYGGRGYGARDPEGHVWSFGTFSPWAEAPH